LILRLSIVAASLAWAGFVFTHTVGDPSRGDRIAREVLADDEARAEVVAPITTAVLESTGLPPEQRPFVASQVDRLLQEPDGARAFVDLFAGSWSRMLGDDDGRGTRIDLTPFIDDVTAAVPGIDPAALPAQTAAPASVPRPRTELPWMGGLRTAVEATTIPLAIAAAVGAATALAIGDRRWVLRRVGIWGVMAGGAWIVGPLIAVWAARRWATGADAVVSVAVEQAVSGMRVAAIVLMVAGLGALMASLAPALGAPAAVREPQPRRQPRRVPVAPAPSAAPRRSPAAPATRVVPQVEPRRARTVDPTMTMSRQPSPGESPPPRHNDEPDGDDLWDFYTEPEA
jgi:hypothetical protein